MKLIVIPNTEMLILLRNLKKLKRTIRLRLYKIIIAADESDENVLKNNSELQSKGQHKQKEGEIGKH